LMAGAAPGDSGEGPGFSLEHGGSFEITKQLPERAGEFEYRIKRHGRAVVEVDCPKLVTDLGRPGFDVVQTIVTHGRQSVAGGPRPAPAARSRRGLLC
jgi:hypothetical protein